MMNNTTTLAIFAIIAAVGLATAAFVVIPNVPAAKAYDVNSYNRYKSCGSQLYSGHNVPNKC